MKPILAAVFLIPALCMADPISIEQADIILDIPDNWKILHRDTFPDAPSNVCFPRFDHKEKIGRIDAVMWKDADSLDQALDRYIQRFIQTLGDNEEHKELDREAFTTKSGVEGIRYFFQTTRQTACGPDSWKLVRYVFRNSQGKIVCLGGFGDIDEIDQIVLSSLETK